MIRATAASNSSRSMFETKRGRLSDTTACAGAGTGPRRTRADVGDRLRRSRVGGIDAAVVVAEGAGEDRQLVAEVIEGEHHVGDHQGHVGKPERVGIGLAERLDGADQVVAEEADGAAGERRQPLDRGRAEARQVLGDRCVGIGRVPGRIRLAPVRRALAPLREHPIAPAQHRPRANPEKGVAPDLALLGRLQQEAGPCVPPVSLRKAETGVSQSSTTVSLTGTTFPSAASSRARSRLGSSRSSGSVADGH